jgi:hypothetical protein
VVLACLMVTAAGLLLHYRQFTTALAIVSVVAWATVWQFARNKRFSALLPAPRVETRTQAVWRGLRTACLGVAIVGTLLSGFLVPRQRFYGVIPAALGILGWLGLAIAERLTRRD